jgi:hypothetical protein
MNFTEIMPIERIPDWEKRIERQDAFWEKEIIDRPVVHIVTPETDPNYPEPPGKKFGTPKEKWFDAEYHAQTKLYQTMNAAYSGDALPVANPNLGPEVFSAYFGSELEYENDFTSWAIPNLESWDDMTKVIFSTENAYWRKTLEITDAFLEYGKNKFYTGITDLHPGGDAIAAFRDPLNLNIDMIECPDNVKELLIEVSERYFYTYDYFYDHLRKAAQACTCWAGIVSSKKWYVPSNDFSCMISKEMFDDVFLSGIIGECKHMEASIYHLDGPEALRHLDSLLEIKELNAIQWVYGAGQGRASDWMHIYKKCQAAGKGLQIFLELDEIDFFMENLKPEGLWISIKNVKNREEAECVIKKIERWR